MRPLVASGPFEARFALYAAPRDHARLTMNLPSWLALAGGNYGLAQTEAVARELRPDGPPKKSARNMGASLRRQLRNHRKCNLRKVFCYAPARVARNRHVLPHVVERTCHAPVRIDAPAVSDDELCHGPCAEEACATSFLGSLLIGGVPASAN